MARKTRTPRVVPPQEQAQALPEPKACQYPLGCTGGKPFASLTFQSTSGFSWTQTSCQAHQQATDDYYREKTAKGQTDGGVLVSVRLLGSEAAS